MHVDKSGVYYGIALQQGGNAIVKIFMPTIQERDKWFNDFKSAKTDLDAVRLRHEGKP